MNAFGASLRAAIRSSRHIFQSSDVSTRNSITRRECLHAMVVANCLILGWQAAASVGEFVGPWWVEAACWRSPVTES